MPQTPINQTHQCELLKKPKKVQLYSNYPKPENPSTPKKPPKLGGKGTEFRSLEGTGSDKDWNFVGDEGGVQRFGVGGGECAEEEMDEDEMEKDLWGRKKTKKILILGAIWSFQALLSLLILNQIYSIYLIKLRIILNNVRFLNLKFLQNSFFVKNY